MANVKINGKEVEVEAGTLILDAARDLGHDIPTFCYQADLMGIGSCRMCLIEIEGQKKLQPSCITPVMDGMSILTDSPTVVSARSSMLEFLLTDHALDCPVCDKGGECELQDMVFKHGPRTGRHAEPKHTHHEKDYALSPVIIKNSNRCVQCTKCVRVCKEIVGVGVLGSIGRGIHQEETSFQKTFLDCDHCGNCIEVCPVGCFMRRPYRYTSRSWDLTSADSICTYCATGCRIVIEERDGTLVRSRAQLGVGLNSETLCARGRFGYDIVNKEERLTTPMVKKYGKLEPATWEEAFSAVERGLKGCAPERIGGLISARMTNEEIFLFSKLFKGSLGSSNVDSSMRWTPEAVEGFAAATSMPEGGASLFDVMASDTVLVVGTQLSDENPVVDYIVRRITNANGVRVAIASSRAMKLDSSASITLRHAPAAEGSLLGATALILADSGADKLAGNSDVQAGLGTIKGIGVDSLATSAGLNRKEIEELVSRLGSSESVGIIAGTEFLRFPEGSANLALFTEVLRGVGKTVTVVPVLDRCNQRGAWEMGAHPNLGTAYSSTDTKGLGFAGMMDAASAGQMDALYIAGENPVIDYGEGNFARDAVDKARFVIVQDTFMTETAAMADVVLPGVTFAEKDGTYTNQEGRVQSINRLLKGPGSAKSDLEIISTIHNIISGTEETPAQKAAGVFGDIRAEVTSYASVDLSFNNKKNTFNDLDNKGSLVGSASASIAVATVAGSAAATIAGEGPAGFTLVTGNHLYHSGRLTLRSEILDGFVKGAIVELSSEDADRLGLSTGDTVTVAGSRYTADLTLKVRKGSVNGMAFIAENFNDVLVHKFFKHGESVASVKIARS
ncbi:MAG: NADH-quinone oxidoreductase subunit NuoG [Proteobacteria bacterium]|nr:NADH-quinone oxidoreductase subunit NuoG [Pseudomonadota bacterium]